VRRKSRNANFLDEGAFETMNCQLSVIIPTYNRAASVCNALESVFAQTIKPEEIVVVDDGSTDDTQRVVQRFCSDVRYIKQPNRGPGAARNTGLNAAHGRFLAFLDSDDQWKPTKVEEQLALMARERVVVCFTDAIMNRDGPWGGRIDSWNAYVMSQALNEQPMETGVIHGPMRILALAAHLLLTPTLIVDRALVMSTGGFDERLLTNQDIDLYLRLALKVEFAYLAKPLTLCSSGPCRAMEVPSSRASGTVRGIERVYKDRIAAYRKAIVLAKQKGRDMEARWAEVGYARSLRGLAGLFRRRKRWISALRLYATYFVIIGRWPAAEVQR